MKKFHLKEDAVFKEKKIIFKTQSFKIYIFVIFIGNAWQR